MSEGAATHHEWDWSPWPLVVSVGMLFMLPLAFSFFFVYDNPVFASHLSGLRGSACSRLYNRLDDRGAPGQEDGHADGQMLEPGYGIKAMPFFILAEAFIFIAFIVAYWVLRLLAPSWPPEGTPHIGYNNAVNNDRAACLLKYYNAFCRA